MGWEKLLPEAKKVWEKRSRFGENPKIHKSSEPAPAFRNLLPGYLQSIRMSNQDEFGNRITRATNAQHILPDGDFRHIQAVCSVQSI